MAGRVLRSSNGRFNGSTRGFRRGLGSKGSPMGGGLQTARGRQRAKIKAQAVSVGSGFLGTPVRVVGMSGGLKVVPQSKNREYVTYNNFVMTPRRGRVSPVSKISARRARISASFG